MVTSAPATGWPSAPTTRPPTPADVLCANAGAAASAAISANDSLDSRTRLRSVIFFKASDIRDGLAAYGRSPTHANPFANEVEPRGIPARRASRGVNASLTP